MNGAKSNLCGDQNETETGQSNEQQKGNFLYPFFV